MENLSIKTLELERKIPKERAFFLYVFLFTTTLLTFNIWLISSSGKITNHQLLLVLVMMSSTIVGFKFMTNYHASPRVLSFMATRVIPMVTMFFLNKKHAKAMPKMQVSGETLGTFWKQVDMVTKMEGDAVDNTPLSL